MTLKNLLEGAEVLSCTADLEREITSVTSDSRKVTDGALFVAVPGFKEDGAKYVPSALDKGAVAVICERDIENCPTVVVKNVRRELSRVSANFFSRPTARMTVVGITGTNGKTTSSCLVRHILMTVGGVGVGLIGTNEIIVGGQATESVRTTPESVEIQELFSKMLAAGERHAVMEVSSHALALDRVADVHYSVAAFTNLTRDHLDFHGDMENYYQAKKLLFSMCDRATINLDDEYGARLAGEVRCPVITTSARGDKNADVLATNIEYYAGGVRFIAEKSYERAEVDLKIPGEFSVHNALTAIGVALSLGVSLSDAARAIGTFSGVKGRAELVKVPADYSVIIDYAHTPDGIENILRALRAGLEGKLTIVFGCGGDRDRTKRPIMGEAAERLADFCVVTSDNPRTEDPQSIIDEIVAGMSDDRKRVVIPDRREAIAWALSHAKAGDVVLLAGKGQETYQEINGVKHHLDEREVVAEFFAK